MNSVDMANNLIFRAKHLQEFINKTKKNKTVRNKKVRNKTQRKY
jgi:hypothetical protein